MKFIWLFGENTGSTHNNNSYYFWEQVCLHEDNIEKYYVLCKTKENEKFVNLLPEKKRKLIVWKNTIKHFELFRKADMYIVSLSYKDIVPEKLMNKNIKLIIKKPVIYLQHGTLALKKLGYKGDTYWNNMFRFFVYNKEMLKIFPKANNFNDYQLYYADYHPRYKELVKIHEEEFKKENRQKQILFFITWREYFKNDFNTKRVVNKLVEAFSDERLINYATENDMKIKICLHQFFKGREINLLKEKFTDNSNVEFTVPSEVDVMKELACSDLLITDFSSVGFDCTFLGTPVILFQPDRDIYFKYRDCYYSKEEVKKYSISDVNTLVETIINNKYTVNEFFKSKLPKKINYNYVKAGKHIEKMYNDLYKLQTNKISIIGYNFTGRGGTVTATKSLSEALLEAGYLVELISLRMTEKTYSLPYGLSINGFYNVKQNKWVKRYKRHVPIPRKYMEYFKYDINRNLLTPYIGYELRKYLNTCNSKTVISTRESVHLFVKKYASEYVKNKIYFFHTDSTVLEDYYPGLLNEIKKYRLENCVFVTNSSRKAYKNDLEYDHYDNSEVIGNSLESKAMILKKYIKINKTEKTIRAVSLMRLSEDRISDIDNIINFGKYLKEQKSDNVLLKIYGQGPASKYLVQEIFDNNLSDYIWYMGGTSNSKGVILSNDCVVDFCNNQSFGMIYIESILNGKPVFALENTGSLEVLKEIPYSYYHSNEELYTKLLNVKKKSVAEYKNNYEIISKKYSRKKIAEEIEKIINK